MFGQSLLIKRLVRRIAEELGASPDEARRIAFETGWRTAVVSADIPGIIAQIGEELASEAAEEIAENLAESATLLDEGVVISHPFTEPASTSGMLRFGHELGEAIPTVDETYYVGSGPSQYDHILVDSGGVEVGDLGEDQVLLWDDPEIRHTDPWDSDSADPWNSWDSEW